ncbi:MAG: hypothetical protein JXX28_01295 [Deltaproteobacteria bacterium]|nr:hypothetical protein [Deltaproteobacteria bacterium]
MFGYDDAALARIRRRSRWTRVRVLGELVVLAVLCLWTALLYLFTTPAGFQRVVDLAVGQAPVRVTVEDVEFLPGARWSEPATWRWAVVGVDVTPLHHSRQHTRIERVILGLPDPVRLWEDREAVFTEGRLIGLHVERFTQHPPKQEWVPREGAIGRIRFDRVEVWDASYHARPDPPFGEAVVPRIYGELREVVYEPRDRLLSGVGGLRSPRFLIGSIDITALRLPDIRVTNSSMHLSGGAFRYGGAEATLEGEIRHFFRRAESELHIELRRAELARVVSATTGRPSPLLGELDFSFDVHAGGALARGGSWMEGEARVREGRLLLEDDVSNVVRDAITLAPFLETDAAGRVILGEIVGKMRIDRTAVDIRDMVYQAPRRTLQLRGHLGLTAMDLVLRVVPHRDADTKPGLGVVVSQVDDGPMRFRLARREELLPGAAQAEEPQGESPRGRWWRRTFSAHERPASPDEGAVEVSVVPAPQ